MSLMDKKNNNETIISEQIVNGSGKIINANTINSNYFDDPLEFYCGKKIEEHNHEEKFINIKNILYSIIDKEGLKKRFGGALYKYESLLDYLDNQYEKINDQFLDDGYASIIKCIYEIVSHFQFYNGKIYIFYNNQRYNMINVKITNEGLILYYTDEVKDYNTYLKAQSIARKTINECEPYIRCAAQYGNFFQFSYIEIKSIENVPFIPQEIRFKVSNNIIPSLIKPLYGDKPECGLREIIQNALDALKEYCEIKEDNFDNMYVEVCLVESNKRKKMIIRDYGIGMDKKVLLEKYFVVGESTKKDSNLYLVGQFGIGALAAFLLGDRIEVRTKYYKEEIQYHFYYNLPEEKLEEEEENNINVSICKDDSFLHGTEVIIELNKELSELDEQKLRERLKLDIWYIMTDFPIIYKYNNKKEHLISYKDKRYKWKKLNVDKKEILVEYCDDYPKESNKIGDAKIIYNGLMVSEEYQLKCDYINYLPCISIKTNNQDIKLNLERTKIECGLEPICNVLKSEIIELGKRELIEQKLKIINLDGQINRFTYSGKYLKNVQLFFTKEGFGVYSQHSVRQLCNQIPNLNIVEVYGIDKNKIKINDLEENKIYLFYEMRIDKTLISDLIERYSGKKYISKRIVKKFFLEGESKYYGLRKKSMYEIYKVLGIPVKLDLKIEELWNWHNENIQKIENKINEFRYLILGDENDCNFENIIEKYKPDFIWSSHSSYDIYYKMIDEDININVVNVK